MRQHPSSIVACVAAKCRQECEQQSTLSGRPNNQADLRSASASATAASAPPTAANAMRGQSGGSAASARGDCATAAASTATSAHSISCARASTAISRAKLPCEDARTRSTGGAGCQNQKRVITKSHQKHARTSSEPWRQSGGKGTGALHAMACTRVSSHASLSSSAAPGAEAGADSDDGTRGGCDGGRGGAAATRLSVPDAADEKLPPVSANQATPLLRASQVSDCIVRCKCPQMRT